MQQFPSIIHAIMSHAKSDPDKAAIIEAEADRSCTYGELWSYVKTFSRRLADIGVKRDFGDGYGTRVVVRCVQAIDYVVSMLAIHLAGGVFVPVEKNIADARIIEIMQDVNSDILIAVKPLIEYENKYIPMHDATKEFGNIADSEVILPMPDALSTIIYTTGTTGKSKGVMHSFRSHTAFALVIHSAFGHGEDEVWMMPNPLSHNAGLVRTFISLYFRCTVVLLDGYMLAKQFFSAISKYKVTILVFMPAAIEMYLRSFQSQLLEVRTHVKYITLFASSYAESQIMSLKRIFPCSSIIQAYGATEVMGSSVDHSKQKFVPYCVGQPCYVEDIIFYDENRANIVNATKEKPGLFALKSDSKMMGYWNNPKLTESVTRGEYIVLSDFGYRGEDGLLYFFERADDVIVSSGYKIAPSEVEDVVNSCNSISESACVAVSDSIMGQVPKLFVVMKDERAFNYSEIYGFLKERLETAKVPRYIEEIDEIPKINNKINRKALKDK